MTSSEIPVAQPISVHAGVVTPVAATESTSSTGASPKSTGIENVEKQQTAAKTDDKKPSASSPATSTSSPTKSSTSSTPTRPFRESKITVANLNQSGVGNLHLFDPITKGTVSVSSIVNGIALIAIGPERLGAEEFISEGHLSNSSTYIDEGRHLFKAFNVKKIGILSGIWKLTQSSNRSMMAEAKEMKIKGNLKGDALQLGGLVIADNGNVIFQHSQVDYSDIVSNEQILDVLQQNVPYLMKKAIDNEPDNSSAAPVAAAIEVSAPVATSTQPTTATKETDTVSKQSTHASTSASVPASTAAPIDAKDASATTTKDAPTDAHVKSPAAASSSPAAVSVTFALSPSKETKESKREALRAKAVKMNPTVFDDMPQDESLMCPKDCV